MGISEAFYIPAALALISDYHTGPTRSKAVGVHQMGIYFGVILGGFAGYAADEPSVGWRTTFQVIGIVGIAYAFPLVYLLRDIARVDDVDPSATEGVTPNSGGDALTHSGSSVSNRSVFSELFLNKSFLLLIAYFTLPALSAWIVRDWMPSILKQSFDISQGLAGVSATLYWQVAAILAALFGGWLADRWSLQSPRGRIYVSAIGTGLIIPALIGVGIATSEKSMPAAIAALILFGVGWGFFDCNNMPILCQIVRSNHRATGYGIMNMVSISCGGLADWGFGKMLDMKLPMTAIFGAFAACCVVSIVIVLSIRPRIASESDATEST
jgi:sugar phosphate permease